MTSALKFWIYVIFPPVGYASIYVPTVLCGPVGIQMHLYNSFS